MSGNHHFIRNIRNRVQNEGGFSIVELGIALIVIGALIGMLLKGQDIIQSVRAVQTAKHLKLIDSAFSSFHAEYGTVPGDLANPERYIRGCSGTGDCAGGNGDGVVAAPDSSTSWLVQLELAGMVPKNYAGSYLKPPLELGYEGALAVQKHIIKTGGFNVKVLEKIDRNIDDGKPNSGRVQSGTAACVISGKNEYNILANVTNCALVFQLKH